MLSSAVQSNFALRTVSKISVRLIMARNPGHWSQGLLASINDPELVIDSDEKVVVIKDKYPKARHHFLVLPKQKIPSLKAVTPSDIDLLKHMQAIGEEIADRASPELRFRFGYHAIPSMNQLHMHVISQDFNSPCLKTRKHWNSFNTSYFVDSADVIRKISKEGKWTVDVEYSNDMLKWPMKCQCCDKKFNLMPQLKAHIVLHDVSRKDSSS